MSIIDHLAITGSHPLWCDPGAARPTTSAFITAAAPGLLEIRDDAQFSFQLHRLDERGPGETDTVEALARLIRRARGSSTPGSGSGR